MPSTAPGLSLTVALVLASAACNPTGSCETEVLQVRMPATVVRHGQSTTTELSNVQAAGQVASVSGFKAIRAFFTDAAHYSGTIAWDLRATDAPLHLALELQGPRQPGEVLPLSPGVFIGQWGPFAPPNGAVAAAGVNIDTADSTHFTAVLNEGEVSGTLEVLGVAPLQLRLDLVATSAAGEEMRIRGDMTAQHSGNELGC